MTATLGTKIGLDLATARSIIDRALKKAAEFRVNGGFAVADEAGILLTLTRTQGGAAHSPHVVRGKAALAAVFQEPTDIPTRRMNVNPERYHAYKQVLPHIFPGPGGMIIKINGRVVGGYGSGAGYGPMMYAKDLDPRLLRTADGQPGNTEDLVTAYALGLPYKNYHDGREFRHRLAGDPAELTLGQIKDDDESWARQGKETACMSVPVARALADAALQAAGERGEAISVAVYDESGVVMQIDRMETASPRSLARAEERGRAAYDERANLAGGALLFAPGPGGLVGTIGIAGTANDEAADEAIVRQVLKQLAGMAISRK